MKYFCRVSEKKGTCYHEWQKGKWDEKTFWREDSLLIHDDVLYSLKMGNLLAKFIPDYSEYGDFELNVSQWEQIYNEAGMIGGELKEAIDEAAAWVNENFITNEVFAIIGI